MVVDLKRTNKSRSGSDGFKHLVQDELKSGIKTPPRMLLTAVCAGQRTESFLSWKILAAGWAFIDVFVRSCPRDRIITAHTHEFHLRQKLCIVAVRLVPHPKPVVNHFMSHRVVNQIVGLSFLSQIRRNLDRWRTLT